jgi:hypothetical protein
MLDEGMAHVSAFPAGHRHLLERLADVLLEKEVLERAAFERLMPEKAPYDTKELLGAAVSSGAGHAIVCEVRCRCSR